jgi:thymidylate synthase (FAD)
MPEEQIIVQLNPDVPPTGSDLGIVNAARRSFGKRSEWEAGGRLKPKDKRLLEFLARGMTADDFKEFINEVDDAAATDFPEGKDPLLPLLWQWRNTPTHDTPFNHGFFSFEVKAPIFVARHAFKHEYLIPSEYSRRYITDDVEFYQPKVWREAAKDVKQGSSDEGVSGGELWNTFVNQGNKDQMLLYTGMIKRGVAPEQARMVLPQSLMTAWTWSGTLGAFANMCKLRLSKDTQYETRLVAQQVYTELKKQFPIAAPLLVEGVY